VYVLGRTNGDLGCTVKSDRNFRLATGYTPEMEIRSLPFDRKTESHSSRRQDQTNGDFQDNREFADLQFANLSLLLSLYFLLC
jgi:hypothetical protein